jgi:hypothetical protein
LAALVVNCEFHTDHRGAGIRICHGRLEAIDVHVGRFDVRLLRYLDGRLAAVLAMAIREARWWDDGFWAGRG